MCTATLVSSKPNATVKELFLQTQKATVDACGVSYRIVQRICAEAAITAAAEVLNNIPVLSHPRKKICEQNPLQTWMILTKESYSKLSKSFMTEVNTQKWQN
ncbi:hypothetical protein AVEN_29184-1 [Araneus ventricosus]|uniref:Uncharacterized protein n=1 Tax=Araneus ventricosus TaxID=182803 RepID=A0A4Y2AK03_ARAVE|nr:hypothetical protein AVEN_29184-1 [Araneus ventricosus]